MNHQQAAQPVASPMVDALSTNQATHRPRQLRGWRTVKELTSELRFTSEKACREWLAYWNVPSIRRGRIILVDGLDVDAQLRQLRQCAARRAASLNNLRRKKVG